MCRNIHVLHNFELVTAAPPKSREVEAEKARERSAKRFATA